MKSSLLKNLGDLSCNPMPCSLPVIPQPLPAEIVEWENFVPTDLLHLLLGSSSPVREPEIETVGRELVIRTPLGKLSFSSEDSSLAPLASRRDERGSRVELLPLVRKGSCPTP